MSTAPLFIQEPGMTLERKVWHWIDVDIDIYSQNCSSLAVDEAPLFRQCFVQDFSVTGVREIKEREVTGDNKPKLVPRSGFKYSAAISGLFFRKVNELDPETILADCSCLAVKINIAKPEYDGTEGFENDTIWLKEAKVEEFTVTGSDNEFLKVSLKLKARTFE